MSPSAIVIDTDYETTIAEDDYDRRAVDAAWADGGENIPADVVWAELDLVATDPDGQD